MNVKKRKAVKQKQWISILLAFCLLGGNLWMADFTGEIYVVEAATLKGQENDALSGDQTIKGQQNMGALKTYSCPLALKYFCRTSTLIISSLVLSWNCEHHSWACRTMSFASSGCDS